MGDRERGRSGSRDRRDGGRDYGRSGGRDSRERGGGGGGRDRGDGESSSLLVRNLSYRVNSDEIRRIFSRYGDVRDVYIPLDYHSQRPRGFAFVEFYDKRDAMDAADHLDRYEVDGRELAVVFAKDRRKTPDEMRPRGGYGRGNSRDRRGGGGDRRGGRNSREPERERRSRSRDRSDRGRDRDEHDDRPEPGSPSDTRDRRDARGERAEEPADGADMNTAEQEQEHRGRSRSRSQHSN